MKYFLYRKGFFFKTVKSNVIYRLYYGYILTYPTILVYSNFYFKFIEYIYTPSIVLNPSGRKKKVKSL